MISEAEKPSTPNLSSGPHLELRGLRAGYGHMEIVHGVDLSLDRGQSLCLVGPNGAGKSTILHAVFGLADVLDGQILISGRNVHRQSARDLLLRAKLAYVPQAYSVFPDMSVEDNLLLGGHVLHAPLAVRAVERILDTQPVLAGRRHEPAGLLSGGERRQLELARSLMTEPEILLIDEPSIGLDPKAIETVFELLNLWQRQDGLTILMVEQNIAKGLAFADFGGLIVSGRLVQMGAASSLKDDRTIGQMFLG